MNSLDFWNAHRQYFMTLHYDEESNEWVCLAPQLPALNALGETPQQALTEMETAMRLYLESVDGSKTNAKLLGALFLLSSVITLHIVLFILTP